MPLSEDGSIDNLIKRLQIELTQVVGHGDLRHWGWQQFRDLDRPNTTDPVELACKALIYLSIDDEDKWRQNYGVLEAILAFLQNRRQASPTDVQLDDLVTTLEFSPVTLADVEAWFREVFPSLEA